MATSQHIVICYSREDTEFMARIRNSLQRVGLQIWTDEGLEPGSDDWKAAIVKAVRKAGAVLVLMSPAANDSPLVKRVVQLAQTSNVEILPLMIAGQVHQSLLPMLADEEYIDLRDDYEGNIIQVVRLCYEFRQQKDVRTTAELHQAMEAEPEPKSVVEAPKLDKSEVMVSVTQMKSLDEIRKNVHRPSEPPNRLRLIVGGGTLAVALLVALIVILFLLGLPPFDEAVLEETNVPTLESVSVDSSSADETSTALAALILTEIEATELALTEIEAPATETDVPPTVEAITVEAQGVADATEVEPTDEPTEVPPTTEPTRTSRPSSTPRPTSTPRPSSTPRPTQIPPTPVPPTPTPVPSATPTAGVSAEDANLEIRYNGDTLVIHNVGDSDLNLNDLQLILVGATDADSILFIAEEWGLPDGILHVDRCVQVWRVEFAELPVSEPPADSCGARSAYRSTPRVFWIADGTKTQFELRRNGNVLAQCDAATNDNNRILTCLAEL